MAEVTRVAFELIVGEVKVVKLASRVAHFLPFLHLLGPHGAVDVHKLIDLEGNEPTRDGSLTVQAAQQASQSLLGVVDQDVLVMTELNLACRFLVLLCLPADSAFINLETLLIIVVLHRDIRVGLLGLGICGSAGNKRIVELRHGVGDEILGPLSEQEADLEDCT